MDKRVLIITPMMTGELLARGYKYPRLVLTERRDYPFCREVCINETRAELQRLVIDKYSKSFDIVVLMDSDVVVDDAALDTLIAAVKHEHTACIDTKNEPWPHVCCACCAVSMGDYLALDYMDKPKECQCLKMRSPWYVPGVKGSEI